MMSVFTHRESYASMKAHYTFSPKLQFVSSLQHVIYPSTQSTRETQILFRNLPTLH